MKHSVHNSCSVLRRVFRTGLCWILLMMVVKARGQEWKQAGVDDIFQKAREKAFNGKRDEAREMLLYILNKSPDYDDVRILLGRTYAWDGRREEARQTLRTVLAHSPQNEDACNALTDVEMWDEQYNQALIVADQGLRYYPNAEDLLYKRARILYTLKRPDEALITLNQLLSLNPGHARAAALMADIKRDKLKYTAGVNYSFDVFSRTYDPAQYASIQLARTNAWGSSILRLNYSHRFSTDGIQPEIDLYPRIANGVYAYLNYGYSASSLFPDHRVGAELFASLPHSLEASAGIRYLYFGHDSKVNIYTGSIGWYVKNYWFSLRPYITPDEETGTSVSATVFARRYFEDRDNYLGLSGGAGFSPDDRRIQTTSGLSQDVIYILKSQRIGAAWSKTLPRNIILLLNFDFIRQELSFDEGEYVLITSMNAGLRKRF